MNVAVRNRIGMISVNMTDTQPGADALITCVAVNWKWPRVVCLVVYLQSRFFDMVKIYGFSWFRLIIGETNVNNHVWWHLDTRRLST
jgi:hypothetical protein